MAWMVKELFLKIQCRHDLVHFTCFSWFRQLVFLLWPLSRPQAAGIFRPQTHNFCHRPLSTLFHQTFLSSATLNQLSSLDCLLSMQASQRLMMFFSLQVLDTFLPPTPRTQRWLGIHQLTIDDHDIRLILVLVGLEWASTSMPLFLSIQFPVQRLESEFPAAKNVQWTTISLIFSQNAIVHFIQGVFYLFLMIFTTKMKRKKKQIAANQNPPQMDISTGWFLSDPGPIIVYPCQ